uniref:Uncharacterized protein n=1 Tax=Opuntia streptacantha TaxID=393608 RepID=A0A7C9CSP3_OPUST
MSSPNRDLLYSVKNKLNVYQTRMKNNVLSTLAAETSLFESPTDTSLELSFFSPSILFSTSNGTYFSTPFLVPSLPFNSPFLSMPSLSPRNLQRNSVDYLTFGL